MHASTGGTRWNRRRVGWVLAAVLGLAVGLQVVPFLLPFEPGPLPPQAQALETAERYAHPIPPAALAKRATSCLGLGLVLMSGLGVAVERRRGDGKLRWPARILFLAAVYAWLWLLGLPHGVARFLHMREFGLTEMTLSGWGRIVALGLPVPFATYLMGYLLMYCCLPLMGRRWWFGAACLVMVFFHLLPEFVARSRPIDPVETLTPLEEGSHYQAMIEVAAAAEVDLEFFAVDESQRSNRINMYLTGRLGREYVVLTDTLLERLTPGEAAVILAHEIGHGVTRHITVPSMKALVVVKLLLALWFVHLLRGRCAVPAHQRLQVLVMVMLSVRLVSFVFLPATSAMTRYREREADVYALDLTDAPDIFAQAVVKTAEINLRPYELPRWVHWLSGTHPSVKERLGRAEAWSGASGGRPAFLDIDG